MISAVNLNLISAIIPQQSKLMNLSSHPFYICPISSPNSFANTPSFSNEPVLVYPYGIQLIYQHPNQVFSGVGLQNYNPTSLYNRDTNFNGGNFMVLNSQSTIYQRRQTLNKQDKQCGIQVDKKNQQKLQRQTKKKYVQNPRRNVITNLGAQILSFLSNKSKLMIVLQSIGEKVHQQDLSILMIYIQKIKNGMGSYINSYKMKEIWYPQKSFQSLQQTIRLFRKVSYYFLINLLHVQVLRSNKMNEQTRFYHLHGIRELIKVIREPPRHYFQK